MWNLIWLANIWIANERPSFEFWIPIQKKILAVWIKFASHMKKSTDLRSNKPRLYDYRTMYFRWIYFINGIAAARRRPNGAQPLAYWSDVCLVRKWSYSWHMRDKSGFHPNRLISFDSQWDGERKRKRYERTERTNDIVMAIIFAVPFPMAVGAARWPKKARWLGV